MWTTNFAVRLKTHQEAFVDTHSQAIAYVTIAHATSSIPENPGSGEDQCSSADDLQH